MKTGKGSSRADPRRLGALAIRTIESELRRKQELTSETTGKMPLSSTIRILVMLVGIHNMFLVN